jgi:hypothetical protein
MFIPFFSIHTSKLPLYHIRKPSKTTGTTVSRHSLYSPTKKCNMVLSHRFGVLIGVTESIHWWKCGQSRVLQNALRHGAKITIVTHGKSRLQHRSAVMTRLETAIAPPSWDSFHQDSPAIEFLSSNGIDSRGFRRSERRVYLARRT